MSDKPQNQANRDMTHRRPEDMVRSDRRWDISALRDWIVLAVMVLAFSALCLSVMLFEPGIR